MKERYKLGILVAIFLIAYFTPWESEIIRRSGLEAFLMLQEYARQHVLTCLIPAFFIAGAIAVFVSQASVLKYFGPQANRILSYCVASVSGTILAVCSCTVLPLFAGIYTRGAGIGPATAFLYSGPAINVLAIVFTARVLGWKLGLARAIGAILFAFIVGILMEIIFKKDEQKRLGGQIYLPQEHKTRPLWQETVYMITMILILLSATIAKPKTQSPIWTTLYEIKWYLTGFFLISLFLMLKMWFAKEEIKTWVDSTWGFMKQIFPLLFAGVLVAGFFLGRPGHEALIPSRFVEALVGGNSFFANFFASIVGALMYFATLTEVPILQGLIGSGMGQGPALALLLAGPALSLPNLLVISSIMGWKKALTFAGIIVVLATGCGMFYGYIVS
ncbi:permease [Desulfothermus okinawensis JCM 13304]